MNHGKPSLLISVLVDELLIIAENDVVFEWFHTEFSSVFNVSQASRKFPDRWNPSILISHTLFHCLAAFAL